MAEFQGRVIEVESDGEFEFKSEADLADWLARQVGGKREVTCDAGRVDVVTDEHAIECKLHLSGPVWAAALGQALMYAHSTGRRPAIGGHVGGPIPDAVLKYADVFVCPDPLERAVVNIRRREIVEEFRSFGGCK